jgi:hypothetical protein
MFEKLIGFVVKELYITTDKTAILLVGSDRENIEVRTVGDCCSDTWIEHCSVPRVPFKIVSMREIEIDTDLPGTRQDVDRVYATEFHTENHEDLSIEYRNSSNGYYGGDLEVGIVEGIPACRPPDSYKPLTESF